MRLEALAVVVLLMVSACLQGEPESLSSSSVKNPPECGAEERCGSPADRDPHMTSDSGQVSVTNEASNYVGEISQVSSSVNDDCLNAATVLQFPVPCPGQLPGSPTEAGQAKCSAAVRQPPIGVPCVFGGAFVFEYDNYESVDPDGNVSHLVISAGGYIDCAGENPKGTATIRSTKAEMIECPTGSGLHSGHSALRWTEESITIVVSVHGHGAEAWKLAEEMSRAIQMTFPLR